MTDLDKAVTRRTRVMVDDRPLLVTLKPGDKISFRAQGTRSSASISVADAYALATKGGVQYTRSEVDVLKSLESKIMIDPQFGDGSENWKLVALIRDLDNSGGDEEE